jgi:streptogramin lyase
MQRTWLQSLLASSAALGAMVLTGCGAGVLTAAGSAASAPTGIAAKPLQGMVMGGQQPVAGVTLQLYQAGTAGYGSAATPLGATATTNAGGNFNLPSYTCTAGSQVYLVGTGGQPIAATMSSPAVTNNNLALMSGLGTCGGTYLSSFINVNELTTVATVWALSPFMTDVAHIGTSSTNTTGLADAFAAINELVTTTNGTMPGPTLPAGATLPTTEINTLADILEQCINSGGGVAGDSSNCGNLFNLAPNAAGTVFPTDTITAAMNIAQNPSRNVTNLNKLRSASPVFQPALDVNSPPNAWTVAITYTGGGLSAPSSLAADASGNVWVTNSGNASVTKFDNTGAVAFNSTAGGFSSPSAIAIDGSGNAWVANAGNNTVTKLNAAGLSGIAYSSNGLSTPKSIAIDGSGDVWVANGGSNQVSAFTASGAALSGSPYSGAGATTPVSVAVTPK